MITLVFFKTHLASGKNSGKTGSLLTFYIAFIQGTWKSFHICSYQCDSSLSSTQLSSYNHSYCLRLIFNQNANCVAGRFLNLSNANKYSNIIIIELIVFMFQKYTHTYICNKNLLSIAYFGASRLSFINNYTYVYKIY